MGGYFSSCELRFHMAHRRGGGGRMKIVCGGWKKEAEHDEETVVRGKRHQIKCLPQLFHHLFLARMLNYFLTIKCL